jgi:GNAT superfamily N-acetyltransferase
MDEKSPVSRVGQERFDEAVDVLCDAFFDYPVMRFVIGEVGEDYPRRLRLLIGFFTRVRFLRDNLVVGIAPEDRLIAVANIDRPGPLRPSPALEDHRDRVFAELGEPAGRRYEAFAQATGRFPWPAPHYHLGMIGVRREEAGRGYGQRLLEYVQARSLSHPDSKGVSLTTETPKNVPFYERFGYRIVDQARVGDFQSWGFFRPDEPHEET